jgi:DNA polymerase
MISQQLPVGRRVPAGLTSALILPDFDFETYSECSLDKSGIFKYATHPSTEILCLAYNLKNGEGIKSWLPGMPLPLDLFNYINNGGLIEAWNVTFEFAIWNIIATREFNFPILSLDQIRCAMAKAKAFGLPGKLEKAAKFLELSEQKDKEGKRLLELFSKPRKPTKHDSRTRNFLVEFPEDAEKFINYNMQDIIVESEISKRVPELQENELVFWQIDQKINTRGVQIDLVNAKNCLSIIDQMYAVYTTELITLTNGEVDSINKRDKILKWINNQEYTMLTLTRQSVIDALKDNKITGGVRRILELRQLLAFASIKKLHAMISRVSHLNRLHNLFVYHSARTGRAAGKGVQPQNLPSADIAIYLCTYCNEYFNKQFCPCKKSQCEDKLRQKWGIKTINYVLDNLIIKKDYLILEQRFKSPVKIISGCLRSLFIAKPGHDLICSDYSAIEAVVLAMLANEPWRIDVFKTHGQIYEMSASKITGIPFEEFEAHRLKTGGIRQHDGAIEGGEHHPLRKKIGKIAELASGYQGWIGAWKQFGASEYFTEDEIKNAILAWRKASPNIVEFWGGQYKNKQQCYYGIEGAAIQSILSPGKIYTYNNIKFTTQGDIMYCKLLSDRYLTYHRPKLIEYEDYRGLKKLEITYETWNTNPKYGPLGWVRLSTYGGKIVENIVQAVARDILAHAIMILELNNYPVVLHVHDEIVSEIHRNFGSVEHFEKLMSVMPNWAKDWPIKAKGGWRGERYRK